MLGLRSSPKEDSGFSPAEAVYGSNLSLPGEFLEHSEKSYKGSDDINAGVEDPPLEDPCQYIK